MNTLKEKPTHLDCCPLLVTSHLNESEFEFRERWKKVDGLPERDKEILSSELTIGLIYDLSIQFNLSKEETADISRIIRGVVVKDFDLIQVEEILRKRFYNLDGSIIFKIKNVIHEVINQNIQEVSSGNSEIIKEKYQTNFKNISLQEILEKFPKIGDQLITSSSIKLRVFPEPVKPSIKNWISDYHDHVGNGKHGTIERGNFLFHSENGKRLNSVERRRLAEVLKSLDEGLELNVDAENQKIIFEEARQSQEEPEKKAPQQQRQAAEIHLANPLQKKPEMPASSKYQNDPQFGVRQQMPPQQQPFQQAQYQQIHQQPVAQPAVSQYEEPPMPEERYFHQTQAKKESAPVWNNQSRPGLDVHPSQKQAQTRQQPVRQAQYQGPMPQAIQGRVPESRPYQQEQIPVPEQKPDIVSESAIFSDKFEKDEKMGDDLNRNLGDFHIGGARKKVFAEEAYEIPSAQDKKGLGLSWNPAEAVRKRMEEENRNIFSKKDEKMISDKEDNIGKTEFFSHQTLPIEKKQKPRQNETAGKPEMPKAKEADHSALDEIGTDEILERIRMKNMAEASQQKSRPSFKITPMGKIKGQSEITYGEQDDDPKIKGNIVNLKT